MVLGKILTKRITMYDNSKYLRFIILKRCEEPSIHAGYGLFAMLRITAFLNSKAAPPLLKAVIRTFFRHTPSIFRGMLSSILLIPDYRYSTTYQIFPDEQSAE